MTEHERGPDRRHYPADAAYGDGDQERRLGDDRRRHSFISQLNLCRGLGYATLEPIFERSPMRDIATGEALLEPGQANHHLYFLLAGRLEIRLKSPDSPAVDVIGIGECIGEMSIIDGEPASAYVVATEPSTVIAVHENVFWSKIAVIPAAMRNLSRVLAERMRNRNDVTLRALKQEMRLEQLENELSAAYEIQVGMLPPGPHLLKDIPTLDVCSRMTVAREVGGDFFDAFPLDENRVCLAIGDVSGKGMPAALFMVQAVTLLRVEMHKSANIVTAMTRVNRALCETNVSHMFVSLIVVTVDVRSGDLSFVNAGHPPFLIARRGSGFATIGTASGLIAGVLEDSVYEAGIAKLEAGDRLLLFTDGVTEARGPRRRFYGSERLARCLNACAAADAAGTIEALFEDIARFVDETPQSDDVTAMAVTFG